MLHLIGLVASCAILLLSLLVAASIPRPLPGIPYDKTFARRPFGEVPELIQWQSRTRELYTFLRHKLTILRSPIVQVFAQPFRRPIVLVSDAQTSIEIMTKRASEFDRSDFQISFFKAFIPHSQVSMKTGEEWRMNRRLVADCMNPKFLSGTAAAKLHLIASDLVLLWEQKRRLAQGLTFSAAEDVHEAVLDAIWTVTFGTSLQVTKLRAHSLSQVDSLPGSEEQDNVEFPASEQPPDFVAINVLLASQEIILRLPAFRRMVYQLCLRCIPSWSEAEARKNGLIKSKLESALRIQAAGGIDCAADLIVFNELQLAKKDGRVPVVMSGSVWDETHGFLFAGHDSTSSTLSWAVKFLTAYPEVQTKLRSSLQDAWGRYRPKDSSSLWIPPASEMTLASVPYLDATVEETLRCGSAVPFQMRTTAVDTQILGRPIPKGTEVWMDVQGHGYCRPSMNPMEAKSASESATGRIIQAWDDSDIQAFKPERWLVANELNTLRFDPQAGPMSTFGGGPRGCFGQRFARLSIRTFLSLVVLNFQLQPIPDAMSTFDSFDRPIHRPQKVVIRLASAMD